MIFVDASVLESAIGPAGTAREEAQKFFLQSLDRGVPLVTSAVTLLEIATALESSAKSARSDFLMKLVRGRMHEVWSLEAEDVYHSQGLRFRFPDLHESGLVKLAACWRRGVEEIYTYDGILRHAASAGRRGTRVSGGDRARLAQQAWREMRNRDP